MTDEPRPPRGGAPTPPAPTPAAPPPEAIEDAGSRALSDALRSSFALVKLIMVALVVVFLGSGFFTVGTQEKAIVLRFGRPVGEGEEALLGPGPHWAFPYPIDEVVKIPIGEVQTVTSTVGWYATSAAREAAGSEPPAGESLDPAKDGYALTADANIIHVRGTVRYRISEPGIHYVFDFVNASSAVQHAFDHALVFAAASFRVDDLLTRDVAGFREKTRARLEQIISQQKLGVVVDQIELQAIPPRQLTAAFAAVLEAEVRRSKLLNDARSYENQVLSRSRSDAATRTNTALAARTALVESMGVEAKRVGKLVPEYRKDPQLFTRLRLTDVLGRIYTNAQDKIVLQERGDGRPRELRLQLNREPPKLKAPEPPKDDHGH